MNNKKFLFSIFITFLAIISAMFCYLNSNVFAEDENLNPSVYYISSLSEIETYGFDKHYILKDDLPYTQNMSTQVFSGILDGNGYKVYCAENTSYTAPLFGRIDGGVVKNLFFDVSEQNVKLTNNGDGYLASVIDNRSFISNIVFNNCQLKYDNELENRGIFAGVISNSVVSGSKITNCLIDYQMNLAEEDETPVIKPLTYNTNMGFIAGKIYNGTIVKNCVIENCNMDIKIGETQATSFNFGGMAGIIENSTFTNNIINLRNIDEFGDPIPTIKVESDYPFNLGGVAGKSDNDVYLYNNALFLENSKEKSNFEFSKNLNESCIGAIFGNMVYELYQSNIEGFVLTTDMNLFGKRANNNNGNSYLKLNVIPYNEFSSSVFKNQDYWNKTYLWDKDENKAIWMFIGAEKYPVLQYYENFDISFSTLESKNSIKTEVPKNEVVSYTYSYSHDFAVPIDVSTEKIAYGSTIYLKVEINPFILDENGETIPTYYDKFFDISKLQLTNRQGETINVFNNETKKAHLEYENISIYESINEEEGNEGEEVIEEDDLKEVSSIDSVIYCITNFNANYSGEYKVELLSQNYKLFVNVYKIETEEFGTIIPGKFTLENTSYTEKVIDLTYGKKITLTSKRENMDYSDVVCWFLYDNSKVDFSDNVIPFVPVEENANLIKNKFEFTFNETCSLFSAPEGSIDATVFDFLEYKEIDSMPNYELKVVYTTRVKQVKIVFKNENDEEIILPEPIIELMINNSTDSLIWNEEEGVYYAKVGFTKSDGEEIIKSSYTIKINQFLEMGYEFIDWQYEMGSLDEVEDEDYAGIFQVDETTGEPLLIVCKLKVAEEALGNNLLWLWITLACVGLLAIIVVIIIVKRRKAKRTAYKKYFY